MKWKVLNEIIEKPISGEWGKDGCGVKVIRTTNFTNIGRLNLCDVVERDIDKKKVKQKVLKPGDIIIEKSGGSPKQPVGRVVYFNEKNELYICNNFTSIIRVKDIKVYSKYLFYFLFASHSFGVTNKFQNKTTGIINLKLQRYIENIEIPLPPLSEQKRIAAILDEADRLRHKDKQLIEQYNRLAQSVFLDMFGDPVTNPMGWEKVDMSKLCSFKKVSILPNKIISGTKYIGLDCLEKETGNIIEIYRVKEGELKSNKFLFDDSYILYGKLRPYLNKVALPEFTGICSTDIIPIKPILSRTNRQFICQIMRNKYFVEFAHTRSSGANLPRISPKEIEKYQTIAPPLYIQNNFASIVKKIELQKKLAEKSLAQSEALFNSLLQKAFRGEL